METFKEASDRVLAALGGPASGQDAAASRGNARPVDDSVTVQAPDKGGRPRGRSNRASRQMTSLAQSFRDAGLDWRADFALAIKARKWRLIQLYVRLMPYMLTGGNRAPLRSPTGKKRLTKTALSKLRELEQRGL